ncbi:hypothetical protein HWV62_12110 [Athelia sp. TMB]|nr:hypothetical protein HWV62_12110 [Athelia sp. TMB]
MNRVWAKRENAVSTNERLQQEAQAVLDVIEHPDVAQASRLDQAQKYLKDNYNMYFYICIAYQRRRKLTPLPLVNALPNHCLYTFGQFQYTYRNYSGAADYFYHFRVLSTDTDLLTSAHWDKLASDILTGKWDVALEELNTLRDVINARGTSSANAGQGDGARTQLHSRTWLAHWGLFVYFNHPAGRTLLLETFLAPTYLATIQTACPWILRHLAAAAVLVRQSPPSPSNPKSTRVKHALEETVKVIQTEEYQYSDPLM